MKFIYKIIGLCFIGVIVILNYLSDSNNPFVYIVAIFIVGTLIASEGYLILLWLFGRKSPIDENVVKLILSLVYNNEEIAKSVIYYYHAEKELKEKQKNHDS